MKDPAALFYIDNWLTSTAEMDSDVRGWYLNLILHQFDKKDLPNDTEKLASLAGVRFSEFERFKQMFEQVFKQKFKQNTNGRLENDMVNEILRRREEFKEKRSDAGRMGYFTKFISKNFKLNKGQLQFIKDNVDLSEIDLKDEQVLKQMVEQMLKLYINGDGDNKTILWKKDFNVYLDELRIAFTNITNDNFFIQKHENLNPDLDIKKTIEKACTNYWSKEKGWKKKKQSGTVNIDWDETFVNSLSMPQNKVWKPKQQQSIPFNNQQSPFAMKEVIQPRI